MASSSSSSPCAACKFLRRKCTAECVFAPYFPPDQPHKFANVHKIFGASNISKLLNELPPHQREDAVNSLAYEAEARVKDPVYGCVGAISVLQRQIAHLQQELAIAHSDLARLSAGSGPSMLGAPMLPSLHAGPSSSGLGMGGVGMGMGMGLSLPSSTQHQQQQLLLASREHLMQAGSGTATASGTAGARGLSREAAHLLDQLQRETQLSKEQLIDQLTRAGGGSLEAGLAAIANMAFTPRSTSACSPAMAFNNICCSKYPGSIQFFKDKFSYHSFETWAPLKPLP